MPRFTAANAREMAARSHAARKRTPNSGEIAGTFAPQRSQVSDDPFALELTRAIEETLEELRACKVAKDRASLAQALRNLRETYHLVTGLERPGVRKGGRRDYYRKYYTAPIPEFEVAAEPMGPETAAVQPASPATSQPAEATAEVN